MLADLIAFRKANPALENGKWGARMQKVETDQPDRVFAWVREEGGNKVLGLFNFYGETTEAGFADGLPAGRYQEFRGEAVTLTANDAVTLPAWGFRLFSISAE